MANESSSLADNIKNIPPVTRFFTIVTVVICVLNSLRLIHPFQLVCYLPIIMEKTEMIRRYTSQANVYFKNMYIVGVLLQSYRFFTTLFLPVGMIADQPFNAILDIYFFYTFSNHLESPSGKFRGNFPDYLWFTMITSTICVAMSIVYNYLIDITHFPVHHQMMLSAVTYMWSRYSKNSIINFLGLVPIKAYYLPLFNLFFKLMISGYSSFWDSVVGIFSAYVYQCVMSDTLPVYNLFPNAYSSFFEGNASRGRRVGTIHMNFDDHDRPITNQPGDFIGDSIFDKGYLKAPLWLYKLLNYPTNNSKRITAFDSERTFTSNIRPQEQNAKGPNASGSSSGFSIFKYSNSPFKGTGHRLGS
ncbi:Piso0_005763 [Millerozyma farinosa CBS 7064]|uniref:Derlin n=1 Tax=Pichia sorbitophila (strain ATCC MYA-4447 / BCRC 22081 / CBS 7064 / NBRC 10061 / NRRL Y-12695) TaxID=559304 RepID=G8XZW1_PICSO|nr:Piso0_005763 [Millerozyma farinosa CBS 7064]